MSHGVVVAYGPLGPITTPGKGCNVLLESVKVEAIYKRLSGHNQVLTRVRVFNIVLTRPARIRSRLAVVFSRESPTSLQVARLG